MNVCLRLLGLWLLVRRKPRIRVGDAIEKCPSVWPFAVRIRHRQRGGAQLGVGTLVLDLGGDATGEDRVEPELRGRAARGAIARQIPPRYGPVTRAARRYGPATHGVVVDIARIPTRRMLRHPPGEPHVPRPTDPPPAATLRHAIGRLGLSAAALLTAAVLGTACSSLPAARPHTPQQTFAGAADAPLARLAAASLPATPQPLSGVQLLADGDDALAARLMLTRLARNTLDAQYYQIAADAAGLQFLRELHEASRRGVRVRLLVDDLHAGELLELLAALDAEPNFEVRLFNPLPARSGSVSVRVLASLHEFDRINRRMHNKLFIADQRLAVAGGRNIGDEYFMRHPQANFFDMDVLLAGAVLPELGAHFDAFWNHRLAYGARSLLGHAPNAGLLRGLPSTPAALQGSVHAQFARGRLPLQAASARVFADAPDKVARPEAEPGEAMERSLQLMQGARRQVLIASPYFVPGPNGLTLLREAIERGIGVQVLTNSLAATDEPLAHQGYARYRLEMLRIGVDLAELSSLPPRQGAPEHRSSVGRLHAKLAVIDRRWLLVGSMNMDLRSSRLNTELTLAVDSAVLADAAAAIVREHWARGQYRLRLDDVGQRIEWQVQDGGDLRSLAREPQTHWWRRLQLGLLSMFVDETDL